MAPETALGAWLLGGVVAYGVLGGADFGGGVWSLFATGPRRDAQRRAIATAMGPVWEANHVWLVFVLVLLFTGFPEAFARLCVDLFVPAHFVQLRIVLRGAAFVFRDHASGPAAARWATTFGVASVITPVLLGATLGALAGGEAVAADDVRRPWLGPVSLYLGGFALAICSYLAAVYLTNEARGDLREDFRRRALLAFAAVAALSLAGTPFLAARAPHLWEGLASRAALPVLVTGSACAALSGAALWLRRFRVARVAAIVHATCLLVGFGIAQHPWIAYPDLTLRGTAAPTGTVRFLLVSVPLGLVVLVPSLWFLLRVFHGAPADRDDG